MDDDIIATLAEPAFVSTRKPRRAAVAATVALRHIIDDSETAMIEIEGESDGDEGQGWEDDDYDAEGEKELLGADVVDDDEYDEDADAEGEEEFDDALPVAKASLFADSYTPTVPLISAQASRPPNPLSISISPLKSMPTLVSPFDPAQLPSPSSSVHSSISTASSVDTPPSTPASSLFNSTFASSSFNTAAIEPALTKVTADLPLYDASMSLEPRRRYSSVFIANNNPFFQSLNASGSNPPYMDALVYPPTGPSTAAIFGGEVFNDDFSRLSFSLSDVRRPSYAYDGLGHIMSQDDTSAAGYYDLEGAKLSLSRRNSLGLALF